MRTPPSPAGRWRLGFFVKLAAGALALLVAAFVVVDCVGVLLPTTAAGAGEFLHDDLGVELPRSAVVTHARTWAWHDPLWLYRVKVAPADLPTLVADLQTAGLKPVEHGSTGGLDAALDARIEASFSKLYLRCPLDLRLPWWDAESWPDTQVLEVFDFDHDGSGYRVIYSVQLSTILIDRFTT